MQIGVKVGDIMTRKFVSVDSGMSITDCAREMAGKKVGSLIIMENKKLTGLLTERDIVWALTKKKNLSWVKAKDLMMRKIVAIRPDRDLSEAILIMSKTKLRWLPVVADNQVIGMLTIKDILKIEPSLFAIARQTMHIHEEAEKIRRKKEVLSGEERWIKWGVCEECESYGPLYNVDGRIICESCKDIEAIE
ncbi:hypothetical protein COS75_03245 [Candidatus Pacearchaeota archaeon CG06_land_8_20_14_3_00_35_12]|nr:MAG: hypothetical protein COS75_03245 [Candidatus Pacearchaeota archaeon CG06_land_8_20_14_3_00_35_12]